MKYKWLLIFSILVFLSGLLYAGSTSSKSERKLSQLILEPSTISEDFVSKSIHRIFQDDEGYIWFGTENQIYRYDGYRLRRYDSAVEHSDQLINNEVLAFAEDERHIWIGTEQGIRIIDKTNFEIRDWDYQPVMNVRINYLMKDTNGNLWIGTQNGLYKHNLKNGQTSVYKYEYGVDNSLTGNGISYIYEDYEHNIWIAIWDCGLCRYVPERNDFDRYPPIPGRNNPFRIFQDKNKKYWLATWGGGLFRFRPWAEGLDAYEKINIRKSGSNADETIFFSIIQDDIFNYIWLVSYAGIFVIKDTESLKYEELFASSSEIPNSLFNEITKDRDGNLWIGTYGNTVYMVNLNRPEIVNYNLQQTGHRFEITPSVSAMHEDDSGLFWLGLKRLGLYFFDKEKNSFVDNLLGPNEIRRLSEQGDINCIREIKSRDEIWVSFEHSYLLFVFKKQGGKVVLTRTIDLMVDVQKYPLTENSVSSIIEDKYGNIWLGTHAGLYRVNRKGELKHIPSIMGHISSMSEDKWGNLWISGNNDGIVCIKDGRISSYEKKNEKLQDDNIQSVCCQLSGMIWAGSKNGKLYYLKPSEDRFVPFVNEFTNKKEPILDIIEDGNGHIWISMNKKIVEVDPLTMNSYVYTKEDGIMMNIFNKHASMKAKSGHAIFGGNLGFCYFSDSKFSTSIIDNDRAVITDIKFQDRSILDTKYKYNFKPNKSELILEPFQNNIEINFSSFNYFSKSKIEFAYKIEGIDDDWNVVSGDRGFAVYNNLPKGTYKFIIKIKDKYGVWTNHQTSLIIHKKPHFYETWFAYLFYAVVIVLILYFFYRSSLNRLKLTNELQIAQIERESSEQLTQTKLRYFTNISHELMTPLTIISCLIDDLKKTSKTDDWQYRTMQSNVHRLKRLLQQILDFRKIESGNMKLKVQWDDIVSFTKDICQSNFSPLLKRKNLNFSFSSSHDKIELYYDTDKIDKVLYNLLSNAIKYTPEGGNINVRIEQIEKNKTDFVRLIVSDTGKGIAPTEISEIFKRFYHSDKTKEEYSNGIGLSLTKELIEMHHGTINVESQLNSGTIFFIEIPLDPTRYAENEFHSSEKKGIILDESEMSSSDIQPKDKDSEATVLIVEDDPELRFILNRILARDYATIMVENGKQALEIIADKDVDVVLSDIVMPEMDGLELCSRLKSNIETSHIPVLLITARNSIEDRVECYNVGADGYLSKPFEQQVLDAKLKSLIKNRKSKQEIFRNVVGFNISTLEYPSSEEKFLNQIIEIIKEKCLMGDVFTPDILASELNMSRSSLYRKIKSLTDMSPSDFIRNIRLKQACVLLKDKSTSIKEVALSIGFTDQRYFSSTFKSEFGMTPSEFQKKNSED